MKHKAALKITGQLNEDNTSNLTVYCEGKKMDISFLIYRIMESHPETIPIFRHAVDLAEMKAGLDEIQNIINPSKN